MSTAILVLVSTGFLVVAATVIFMVLVVGIRRGDRGHLSNLANSNSETFARRILIGVRYPSESEKEESQ